MHIAIVVLTIIQIFSAVGMVGLILLQQGKGADMTASLGGAGSGSLFGASGGANFLSRSTAILATLFFISTLVLAYFSQDVRGANESQKSVLETKAAQTIPSVPASNPQPLQPALPVDKIPGQ